MIKISNISVWELCEIFKVKKTEVDLKISLISLDSREKSKEGFCFFAIKGEKHDGNDFVCQAIENGAKIVISDKEIDNNTAICIRVDDTKKALGILAKHLKGITPTIGITGSVGKTTTKDMIKAILSEKFVVNATEGNNNNEIGVPITILKNLSADYHVIEMGMRNFGEIDWLSFICSPEISIITNAGTSHIGILKDESSIFKCKSEIINNTKRAVILPNEERFKALDVKGLKTVFVGDNNNISLHKARYFDNGIEFDVKWKNSVIKGIKMHTFSEHNLKNAMFAISAAKMLNLNDDEIRSGLSKFKSSNMREEYKSINGITVICDCYNASFESMKSAIISLKKYSVLKNKTPYALLGDMLELGEYSREFHYRIGELAKDIGIKNIFAQGKYAPEIIDGFAGGVICQDKKEIAKIITKSLGNNDVILVKASRKLNFENIIKEMEIIC